MNEGKFRAYLAAQNTEKRKIERQISKLRIVELYFSVNLDEVVLEEVATSELLERIREDYLESRTAKPLSKAVEEYRACMTEKKKN